MPNLSKFETLKKDFLNSLPTEKYNLLADISDYSQCITDFLFRHTEELDFIYDNLSKPLYGKEKLLEEAKKLLDISDDNQFIQSLTYFKMKHFARIVAKDIYKKSELLDLTEEYSYLADVSFQVAYERAYNKYIKRFGYPLNDSDGNIAEGVVVGLGKLGGLDLNYYSDVDVMYLYSDEGMTDGERSISNREFFIKLFTDVTTYLSKRNVEGQAWIVDLDLRPEGKKGFIAVSLPFIEAYYWSVGRTWERHMLLKARHSAGSKKLFDEFNNIIQPFIFQGQISEEVIKEIVEMKKLIELEASKKILNEVDVKRGEGGIREIEFTIQIHQLLFGYSDKELREKRTIKALEKLIQKKIIPPIDGNILKEAYLFLRRLEHIIQIKNCTQTQVFHYKNASEYAKKMGFKSKRDFLETFESYRKEVRRIFNRLTPEEKVETTPLKLYILTEQDKDEVIDHLKQLGFKNPEQALNLILNIFKNVEFAQMNKTWQELLIDYIPELEKEFKNFIDKDSFLVNLVKLLIDGKMLRIFASALEQNKNLVEFILNIAKSSDYITNIMSKDPEILDFAFGVEDILTTAQDFEKELEILNIQDLRDRLKKLKKIVEVLATLKYLSRIHEENGKERVQELNKTLTNLADFILDKLLNENDYEGLVVYGLGKLGSKEMNIGSDLDLIFAFKNEELKQKFHNVPLKITKDLTSYTKEGVLYQLDLRLRPYGKSGELSPTLDFYKNYFENHAKSWERLAWTKSRFIAGEEETRKSMDNLINEFLFSKELTKEFIDEAIEMRYRLEGISGESLNVINIKLGKGGISDIEFLVQLKLLKEKDRNTNILEGVQKYFPYLLDDYIFLREIETRLRMIKGTGSSKIQKNSSDLFRVSYSFGYTPEEFWNKMVQTKTNIRNSFIKLSQKV